MARNNLIIFSLISLLISAALWPNLIKLEDGLFYEEKAGDLFYVAEKVTQDSVARWREFRKGQNDLNDIMRRKLGLLEILKDEGKDVTATEAAVRNYKNAEKIIMGSADPIEKFRTCLNFYDKAQVYVMYVLNTKPVGLFDFQKDKENIEMLFAMLTAENTPFQLHMGIFRNQIQIKNGKKRHAGISTHLHGFSAKVGLELDPQRKFMISTPIKEMREILDKALPADAISVGTNFDKSPLLPDQDKTYYDVGYEFVLKDRQGNIIFEIKNEKDNFKDIDKYLWFLSNTQPSESHPYVLVDLQSLADLFKK